MDPIQSLMKTAIRIVVFGILNFTKHWKCLDGFYKRMLTTNNQRDSKSAFFRNLKKNEVNPLDIAQHTRILSLTGDQDLHLHECHTFWEKMNDTLSFILWQRGITGKNAV